LTDAKALIKFVNGPKLLMFQRNVGNLRTEKDRYNHI
jgi:hypothetical protein